MRFRVKKDLLYILLFWGPAFIFIWPIIKTIIGRHEGDLTIGVIIAQIIMALLGAFFVWVWFGTKYEVRNQRFFYSFGPFKESIDIHDIRRVDAVRGAMVGPSLSMQRVELTFRKDKQPIQISPADRVAFAQALKDKNRRIQLSSDLEVEKSTNS